MVNKLNILIISNDPVLVHDLNEFGHDTFARVEVVPTAEDALTLHEIGRFDIIYLDLDMPGMSGSELIKNIKNYDRDQEFVVLMNKKDEKQLFSLVQHEVSSFIIKPLSNEKFKRISNKSKVLLKAEDDVADTDHEHELNTNILIQQSKLAQTGEMISMIAHQWRQPLAAITAIAGTIRTRMDLDIYKKANDPYAQLESDLYNAFNRIEESADFLSKTVNDFRSFYRPETGITTFNVADSIDSVCRMALLDKEHLDIELKLTLDKTITLNTFENELKQVLINIINNAKDAFVEKTVAKPKLRITLKHGGSFIYINITDNAGGIAPENIEHIFLPYFSTKSEKNGTGIGLHMSKIIVENHIGGILSMTNNTAFGGADFCIQIPFTNQEEIA